DDAVDVGHDHVAGPYCGVTQAHGHVPRLLHDAPTRRAGHRAAGVHRKTEGLAGVDVAHRAVHHHARNPLEPGAECQDLAPAVVVQVTAVVDHDDVAGLAVGDRVHAKVCDGGHGTGCGHADRHRPAHHLGAAPARHDPLHGATRDADAVAGIAQVGRRQ